MRRRRVGTAAVVACCVGFLAGCGPRQPWRSELVTTNPAGTDAANGMSLGVAFSPDGTVMAITSQASDLGPTDTNGRLDVYLRDVASGATTLVSTDAAGTDSADGASQQVGFSPDGARLAFVSDAPDVVAGGTTAGTRQIYLYDLASGDTTLVSGDATGTGGADADAVSPRFSPDGSRVVFESPASDLVAGDGNGRIDVFVRDLATGVTELISGGNGHSFNASFALDGTAVVFESGADDLVAGDANGTEDVFLRDLATGTTTLVSARADGTGSGNGQSLRPVVRPDGDAVAFPSAATDLGPVDTYEAYDIYVRDLVTGTVTLASAPPDGEFVGDFFDPVWSPDGTRITFMVGGGTRIVLHDLTTGDLEWVTTGTAGGGGIPVFSPDGGRLAFSSRDSNLGPTDTNGGDDVYVRHLASGTTTLVSANADGDDSADGDSAGPLFTPDGQQIAFRSDATDLGPTDTNGVFDVYLATLTGADLAVALAAAPEPVAPGGTVSYQVDVTNDGPDTGEDTTVALLLPPEVTFDGAAPSVGSCDPPPPAEPRLVVCDVGDLAEGAAEQVVVTAEVPTSTAPGTLVAIAAVSSPTVDPVGSNGAVAETTVADG